MQTELYYFISFLIIIILITLVVIFCWTKNNQTTIVRNVELIPIQDRIVDVSPAPDQKVCPRIVQTYKTRELPKPMYHCAKSWQMLNPEYNYYFYSDPECRTFLIEHFDRDVVKAFDILIPGAFKADLFRICELYINGGFYIDVCSVPNIDFSYFQRYDVDLILVRDRNVNDIYNAFIYACPKHPFIEYLVKKTTENVLNRHMGNDCLEITGPKFIGKCWREYYNFHFDIGYHESEKILILDHNSRSVFDFDVKIFDTKYPDWELDRPAKSKYGELWRDGNVFKSSFEVMEN